MNCEFSEKGFPYYKNRSELDLAGNLHNLEIRDFPKTVKIKCGNNYDKWYYLGRMKGQYYHITRKLSVYEPYFFYFREYYLPIRVFVIGKFFTYPDNQSTKYNAIVNGHGFDKSINRTTFIRVINQNGFSNNAWGHSLLNDGKLKGSTLILHQEKFLHFSERLSINSRIMKDKIYISIRDGEMAYKLTPTSRPIYATGSLNMLGKDFYEAKADIPESSWRAFVEDFFTFEKFPFTNVPMAGFKQVLLQAIKTLKVKKYT